VRRRAAAVVVAALACGCGGGKPQPTPTPPPASKGLGDMMADTAWDTQVLREASNAANEVVRSAGDCEAVRPIIGEAKARLDAAEPRLRTGAGRGSLDALRKQVAKVEDLCAGTGN
jgi:hypothetical protein